MSLLQWLRAYNTDAAKPTPYKSGNTLVAIKYLSPFNPEFFFQYVIMNLAHTESALLFQQSSTPLPHAVEFFATAAHHFPSVWNTKEGVQEYFSAEAHKAHYVATLVAYVTSLHDVLNLWKLKVHENKVEMSPQQLSAFNHMKASLQARADYYERTIPQSPNSEDDSHNAIPGEPDDTSWNLYTVLLGKPGTG